MSKLCLPKAAPAAMEQPLSADHIEEGVALLMGMQPGTSATLDGVAPTSSDQQTAAAAGAQPSPPAQPQQEQEDAAAQAGSGKKRKAAELEAPPASGG